MNTLEKTLIATILALPLSGAAETAVSMTTKSTGYYNLNVGDYTKPQKSGDLPAEGAGKIVVSDHALFSITLPSNPTTGYSWGLSALPDSLMLLDTDYRQSDDCNGMIGCGGYNTYTFKAIKQGSGDLTFQYGQQWNNTGYTTRVIRIMVK